MASCNLFLAGWLRRLVWPLRGSLWCLGWANSCSTTFAPCFRLASLAYVNSSSVILMGSVPRDFLVACNLSKMKYFSISANYSLQILVVNPQRRIFPSWQNFWPPPFFIQQNIQEIILPKVSVIEPMTPNLLSHFWFNEIWARLQFERKSNSSDFRHALQGITAAFFCRFPDHFRLF